MSTRQGIRIFDIERALDEFFNELLVERWHCGAEVRDFARSEVADYADRYEVRVAMPAAPVEQIEVDVSGQRLVVRAPHEARGAVESAFTFSDPIDRDAVSARWKEGTLIVVLPKLGRRRIKPREP